VGGMGIEGGNPVRTESMEEAVALDTQLRAIWSQHPQFFVVGHDPSFSARSGTGSRRWLRP
jgi:hypothetical protein